MLWCSFIELDALLSIIMLIIYGLFSLKNRQAYLGDVYLFCRLLPMVLVAGFSLDAFSFSYGTGTGKGLSSSAELQSLVSFDAALAVLLFFIMFNFRSLESVLLLLFAFVGQYYMLHSTDLLSFFIALEAQNFCFIVLCGLPSLYKGVTGLNVEAALKYFLLSAFSSGVILFWFSLMYLQTGSSTISFLSLNNLGLCTKDNTFIYQILCAMMFKLGAAPLHLWVVQIYSNVKRQLVLYIATAPKVALFGFWINSFHAVWTDHTLLLFALFSLLLGSISAYAAPALRALFAYSTVNEIGLLLAALEVAGFTSLIQHLSIYIISQLLLWNLQSKSLITVVAVSLAGIPPLAGFFGKAFIIWNVVGDGGSFSCSFSYGTGKGTGKAVALLVVILLTAGISLVYYLRVLRLFYRNSLKVLPSLRAGDLPASFGGRLGLCPRPFTGRLGLGAPDRLTMSIGKADQLSNSTNRSYLTSLCLILLVVIPFFFVKPFVL